MTEGLYPKLPGDVPLSSELNDILSIHSVVADSIITAGNVVYFNITTGKAYVSSTSGTNDIRASGIALTSVGVGETVSVMTRGVYNTSGLTAQTTYYLGAAGALSTTVSGVRVGVALSTTQLFINIKQDNKDSVGTIKAYLKSFTNLPLNNLTAFWKECDGSTLTDSESPLNGQALPFLNGTTEENSLFLVGKTTSGTTTNTSTHSHSGSDNDRAEVYSGSGGTMTYSGGALYYAPAANYHIPPYYSVVYIIKVK